MTTNRDFGPDLEMDAVHVDDTGFKNIVDHVAPEVPLTIVANGQEIATLLVSPSDIEDLVRGYLFTSGFIGAADEMTNLTFDRGRWVASVDLARNPDPELMRKRLYTSGCGKCAMYTTVGELAMRGKLDSTLTISKEQVYSLASTITEGSELFRTTGSVHSALLIDTVTSREIAMDDVARHNAVDKVIGRALWENIVFSQCVLARTGRTSSEIVHKVRRAGIAVTIARGAPTHQAIHLAREMGITLIGFARGRSFNIYSHPERVLV